MNKINPSVKTITLLLISFMLSFNYITTINMGIIILSIILLLMSKTNIKKAAIVFMGAILVALSLFFTSVWFGTSSSGEVSKELILAFSSAGGIAQGTLLATRILAFAGVGILFTFTTNPDDLVVSYIHTLKLPIKYAYGILAAFHFSENIKREYLSVKLAFKVRGIKIGVFSLKPLFVMLVNSLHWSDSIAAAMESKGFDGDGKRSYYSTPQFSIYDFLVSIFAVCFTVLVLWCNKH